MAIPAPNLETKLTFNQRFSKAVCMHERRLNVACKSTILAL